MTSIFSQPGFDRLEAIAHDELQSEFGTQWVHIPMERRPNFSPRPDPTRTQYVLRAVFCWEAKNVRLGMEETGVSSRDPVLYIDICDLQYSVRLADQFRQCGTNRLFEVTDNQKDGMSGVKLSLVQVGRST